jgi:mono/diheme cytochrome c family protein
VFPPVKQRSPRLAGLVSAALILAVFASACGRSEEPDLVAGKTLFSQKCGSCHALNRAGTKGTQGPNLDDAFGPARDKGLDSSTIEGVVHEQIGLVRRGSTMPEDLVKGEDARNVAAYVGEVAGLSGKDQGALANAGQPKVSNKPIAAKGGKLEMPADPTGGLAFASSKATAMAGMLELVSVNKATIPHNIALKDSSGKILAEGPDVTGGTSKVSATVKPGKYEFVCTVPGHEEGGMKGELTVK